MSYSGPPARQETRAAADAAPELDLALVERAVSGSSDAFGHLASRYSRFVRAVCAARLGGRDLDDVVQEVFLRAFRSMERLQDPASFPAYLARIAKNYCVDRLRSKHHRDTVSLDEVDLDVVDDASVPEPGRDEREEHLRWLRSQIGRLPESQREVLLLFHMERHSYADMARLLGISEAAVNQRLSRARSCLREALARRNSS